MTDNAKIAAYFNIEPIDFATDSGFFVLLDALKKKWFADDPDETEYLRIVDCGEHGWRIDIRWGHHDGDVTLFHVSNINLKTALVAATLEFIEREQTK